MRAMIVDDSAKSVQHIRRLLYTNGGITSRRFESAKLALEAAANETFDLVIVNHTIPSANGIEFTRWLRNMTNYPHIPIVIFIERPNKSLQMKALKAGATDFLPKTLSQIELQAKLNNLIIMSRSIRQEAENTILWNRAESATRALRASNEELVFRLARALEYRDSNTSEHTLRVAQLSRMIAKEMGLAAEFCRMLYLAAPLHDIGKVAIPDRILLKPGPLDPFETSIMQTHALVGEQILGNGSCDLVRLAAEIAGHHHERWDGTGYPRRLAGDAIPFSARIVAVADVFDAMTTERAYKKAIPVQEALNVVLAERGKHFDPQCVDAFLLAYMRLPQACLQAYPTACCTIESTLAGAEGMSFTPCHEPYLALEGSCDLDQRNGSSMSTVSAEEDVGVEPYEPLYFTPPIAVCLSGKSDSKGVGLR